jgi:hypothetical protein
MEDWWSDIDGEIEVLGGGGLSLCYFVHPKSHVLAWDRIHAFVIRDWWITSWAMAQSCDKAMITVFLVLFLHRTLATTTA